MRKISSIAVAGLLALSCGAAYAGPADVVRGNGCIGFDANGTPAFDPNANLQFVFTNNADGVANVRAKVIFNLDK
jgi:hypothetical protein